MHHGAVAIREGSFYVSVCRRDVVVGYHNSNLN